MSSQLFIPIVEDRHSQSNSCSRSSSVAGAADNDEEDETCAARTMDYCRRIFTLQGDAAKAYTALIPYRESTASRCRREMIDCAVELILEMVSRRMTVQNVLGTGVTSSASPISATWYDEVSRWVAIRHSDHRDSNGSFVGTTDSGCCEEPTTHPALTSECSGVASCSSSASRKKYHFRDAEKIAGRYTLHIAPKAFHALASDELGQRSSVLCSILATTLENCGDDDATYLQGKRFAIIATCELVHAVTVRSQFKRCILLWRKLAEALKLWSHAAKSNILHGMYHHIEHHVVPCLELRDRPLESERKSYARQRHVFEATTIFSSSFISSGQDTATSVLDHLCDALVNTSGGLSLDDVDPLTARVGVQPPATTASGEGDRFSPLRNVFQRFLEQYMIATIGHAFGPQGSVVVVSLEGKPKDETSP